MRGGADPARLGAAVAGVARQLRVRRGDWVRRGAHHRAALVRDKQIITATSSTLRLKFRFLNLMASYDVAINVCQALCSGAPSSARTATGRGTPRSFQAAFTKRRRTDSVTSVEHLVSQL